jgi:hypothetical protein
LANYPTLEEFRTQVGVVNNDKEIWSSIANQPFLSKRPNLDEVRALMSRVLEPLKAELK